MLALAEPTGVGLMLENTYEQTPTIHREILCRLNSPGARFCLDVGHTLAFAGNSWRDWLPELSPWLGHLHLHDNRGGRDELDQRIVVHTTQVLQEFQLRQSIQNFDLLKIKRILVGMFNGIDP